MKFWKGPKHFNILAAKACIIAGSIGLIMELLFKDWTGVKLCLIVIFAGGAIYGFQAIAWKQWEDRNKSK